MMARLLDDAPKISPGSSETTKPPQQTAAGRRLSLKTRQASAALRTNYRASKVALSSSTVAHISSKCNTIVIDDGPQGRALLRKLSSNQRKNGVKDVKRKPKIGVVKAVVEKFENQDRDKTSSSQPHLKKGNDFRPKFVVVRKSSSISSIKSETTQEPSIKCNAVEKSAKEHKMVLNNEHSTVAGTELKQKPSLKPKPNLRHDIMIKDKQHSLSQRIAKLNESYSIVDKRQEEVQTKPIFSLINDRIAQFNKCDELSKIENRTFTNIKSNSVDKNQCPILSLKNDNQQTIISGNSNPKTINITDLPKENAVKQMELKNSVNITSITKLKEVNVKENDFIKGKEVADDISVCNNMPDIVQSAEMKCKEMYSVQNICINNGDDDSIVSVIEHNDNLKLRNLKSAKEYDSPCKSKHILTSNNVGKCKITNSQIKEVSFQLDSTTLKEEKISKTLPKKESVAILKSVLKPYVLDYTNPSPINIDRMKPNKSFLWKPTAKISIIREVPIYDDSLQSQNISSQCDHGANDNYKTQLGEVSLPINDSNLNLNVADSFILEMTEQIDRRFTNEATKEDNIENCASKSAIEDVKENTLKNPSFLHGKFVVNQKFLDKDPQIKALDYSKNTKPDLVQSSKIDLADKPPNNMLVTVEDLPPKLPEKKPRPISNPPPIPPSHPITKVAHKTDEDWLETCKKILEIPPPLRKQRSETYLEDEDLTKSIAMKRSSISGDGVPKNTGNINLNKWNSLPSEAFNLFTDNNSLKEDDPYSSIQHSEKGSDADSYEIIEENNYAEIAEVVEGRNIYREVNPQEQEDYYEAINTVTVQNGDSDSSCDQSNSLYGLAKPSSGSVYQATGGSETSDEWVDLDNSDDQQESVLIYRENDRSGRGLVATESWSMKVRRQWSRHAADNPDGSEDSVSNVHSSIDNVDDIDDFDDSLSDSSFDSEPPVVASRQQMLEEKRSQPLAEGIYGLMKQAGKSMRKHWTLGKSLTRLRKNKTTSSMTPTNLGQRGWSFKTKENIAAGNSTFYLNRTGTLSRSNTISRSDNKQQEMRVDPRRLSTSSVMTRPTAPPPPPPLRMSLDETSRRRLDIHNANNSSGDSSGYAEGQRRLSQNGNRNSMWYLDNSTDSASEHGSSQGSDLNLRFADEPLYQFYAADIAEMALTAVDEEGGDEYEEIATPSSSTLDLAAHNRSLWCEVQQVINSRVLDTLSQTQKRLQEAKFEVMTSEASYFKSLMVLDKVFATCPLFSDDTIISREDRAVLFGNVHAVRRSSEKMLGAMQKCWQNCILLQGICDVVYDRVSADCEVYVRYCTNQISIDHTLKRLNQNNSNFKAVLSQLEKEPECQSLALYSFLMLPMQRITRLRLLFETMSTLLDSDHAEYGACQKTLNILNKCVAECNEGARSQERYEELVTLSKQLQFPPEMAVPLLVEGCSRWLVRSGQLSQVNIDAKQTFGRRPTRTGHKLTLFLLTDLLIVTKKKSEGNYLVVDRCQRSLVEAQETKDVPGSNRYLLQLTLLENTDNKTTVMTLSCETEAEQQRWLQALQAPKSEDPAETVYEDWDCPQVGVVHAYQPSQSDELLLSLGDIINVLRKTEGWYYGERTRDGEKGWFPGDYTREIASKHTRARNIKQRHRLLQLSADFVQQQRKLKR